ncbi:hypothetical protein IL306_006373 [Fusarium sp. DS 682]|nr:hypothetical protein IL306_006373 [Fusarium sp. DS 682]
MSLSILDLAALLRNRKVEDLCVAELQQIETVGQTILDSIGSEALSEESYLILHAFVSQLKEPYITMLYAATTMIGHRGQQVMTEHYKLLIDSVHKVIRRKTPLGKDGFIGLSEQEEQIVNYWYGKVDTHTEFAGTVASTTIPPSLLAKLGDLDQRLDLGNKDLSKLSTPDSLIFATLGQLLDELAIRPLSRLGVGGDYEVAIIAEYNNHQEDFVDQFVILDSRTEVLEVIGAAKAGAFLSSVSWKKFEVGDSVMLVQPSGPVLMSCRALLVLVILRVSLRVLSWVLRS